MMMYMGRMMIYMMMYMGRKMIYMMMYIMMMYIVVNASSMALASKTLNPNVNVRSGTVIVYCSHT